MIFTFVYLAIGLGVAAKVARYFLDDDAWGGDSGIDDYFICALIGVVLGIVWPATVVVGLLAIHLRNEVSVE